ncbi:iron-containing redox enzyme family protein [Cellulomonas xiejunii]|uniref:Iron-containing redox enzyme family protein n=1 Tax=Cellulomonas xiejunii TaxID=2968083 RepID=A0ABY5KTC8_9CELL|nr:iron-containing redox enzyme family protein [Cellulomonas xiejunii]MCC2322333.1 iron-containing redox enzyme family protein [Cellulomonas xiejunii]UUI72385.1 iron-containing redox enzyme family protein [Cellulomonas xiejunii]
MTTQLPSPAPLTAARPQSPMPLPTPRGPLSDALLRALTGTADPGILRDEAAGVLAAPTGSWLEHDDVQLALTCMYELHYRGLDGVDDDWEWQPDVLAARAALERAVEAELRERVTVAVPVDTSAAAVAKTLFDLTSSDDGPSMSRWIARRAEREQIEEFVVHRSVYQLKEADPHTWAVPRLGGAPKVALMEIQSDEYGAGDPERQHAALFAQAMRGLGLDDTYGRYVDHVPAITLAHPNVMSMLGLHRRLLGAIVGHLAAFEMTSSIPNRLYGNGMRRVGLGQDVTEYFDEHVEADAVHEQIAGRDMAGRLVEQEPTLGGDVVWGAAVCLALDGMWAQHVLDRWEAGEPSLRQPLR